jgi:hypothetical protein
VLTSEDQAVAAGHRVDATRCDAETDGLFDRMAVQFPRVETRRLVRGLCSGWAGRLDRERGLAPGGELTTFRW